MLFYHFQIKANPLPSLSYTPQTDFWVSRGARRAPYI